ncbi:MAG: DUF5681 domain-containing protein [Leptospiraceae bacterium]|nr:DUF5681 domain-containing protein [Leptospiraceae bacterium]
MSKRNTSEEQPMKLGRGGNPPPIEKGFKKGKSGNPNGRPKGKLNRSTLFNRWAEIVTKTKNPLTEQIEGLTQDDLVILSLLNKARKGDVLAIREWLDSRFGKIKEFIEVEQIDKNKLRDDFAQELNSIRDNTK